MIGRLTSMQVLPEVKHSKILITGAQGFIGRYLTREIVKYNPKQPLLLGKSPRRNFEDAPTAEYIQMDLRNRESLESLARLHNFDVIYNLAEKIDQSTGAGKYEEQFAINYLATLYLVEAFQSKVKKFIQIGTNAEYGNAPVSHHSTTTREQPNSAYGVSKLAATKMLIAKLQSENINVKIIRPFLVFGVGQNPKSLLGQVLNAIKTNEPLKTSAKQQTRDFISVIKVVEKLVENLTIFQEDLQIENCCARVEIKILDVLEYICSINANFSYYFQSSMVRKTEMIRSLGFVDFQDTNEERIKVVKEDLRDWLQCEV